MMGPIRIPIAEDCYSTFYLRDNDFRYENPEDIKLIKLC